MNGFLGEFNRMLDRFLTPAVKKIFLLNIVICLGLIIFGSLNPGFRQHFVELFGLFMVDQRAGVTIYHPYPWQLLTYMFVHVQVLHLAFNMLVLWWAAPPLEERWGTASFWKFYLTVGISAGLIHALVTFLTGYESGPLIGASGALYGVMLAFAAYYPEVVVYVWGVFPMKIKHLIIVAIIFEFMATAGGTGESNVSNLTHLTGLAIAYVYLSIRHREWNIRRWQWR